MALACLLAANPAASAAELHRLEASESTPRLRRVRAVLEVNGQVKLNADGKQVTKLPMMVKAELLYDERALSVTGGQRKHARYYHEAQATLLVGSARQSLELPDDKRLLVAHTDSQSSTIFSPLGPLSRDALELVDIQGSSIVLDQLLAQKEVQVGDSWKNQDSTMALLLGLEAVHQNDTESTLRKVEGPIAIVHMDGTVSGAVRGVSTEVELKAIYNFDQALGQVTWLAMSIKETRAIGHAEPGIEATARVRVAVTSLDESPQLSDQALAGLPLEYQPGMELLDFHSRDGGFRMLHGRGWQVMVDRADVAILRLIDRGDLIAQCNASNLPRLKPDQRLQLPAFQADVERALGDKFGQFVEASETTTDQQLRVLRAVVSGVVSELPIQWTYYHISDDSGRQAALVFTLDANLVERFAEADRALISSFEFRDLPEPAGEEAESAAPRTATREAPRGD